MKAKSYTCLQKKEIAEGRRNGLSEEEISIYADPGFNYLQMQEIRKALEAHLDSEKIRLFARSWITAEEMKEIREAFDSGADLPLPKKKKKRVHGAKLACMALPAAAFIAWIVFDIRKEPLQLTLKSKEIILNCGETFQPEAQILNVTEGKDVHLTLPEAFKAEHTGDQIVSYSASRNGYVIQQLLRIHVIDQTAPILELTMKHALILNPDTFSCRAFIAKAEDDQDGNLMDHVSCSSNLSEEADQEVHYVLKDSSGNQAEQVLQVHIESVSQLQDASDPPKETDAPEETEAQVIIPSAVPTTQPAPSAASTFASQEVYEEITIPDGTEQITEVQPAVDSGTTVEYSIG